MDFAEAAHRAAAALSKEGASGGDLERAREILLLARDAEGAARLARRMGEVARARAEAIEASGDTAAALTEWFDAAVAFDLAGDDRAAKECSMRVLGLWRAFEESKQIQLRPARASAVSSDRPKRMRRLPKAGPRPAETSEGPDAAASSSSPTVLPAMFLEMHARALKMAGKDKEAKSRFDEAIAAVEAEVARRRGAQEWGEALAAARAALRLALATGGRARLDSARPDFIALARDAAAEALTPDYFARGRQDVPGRAIELALLEAHALGNESLALKYEAEAAEVLERTAEILEALTDERTAAEAVLSWEEAWPMLAGRPDLRRALMETPDAARSLTGPFAALAGIAASHPLRRDVDDFLERVDEVTARARAEAPPALLKAAESALLRDAAHALDLGLRARKLLDSKRPVELARALAVLRDAYLALGRKVDAAPVHEELVQIAEHSGDREEAKWRRAALDAQLQAGGSFAARSAPAVRELAAFLVERGARAWQKGEEAAARADFEEAAWLGNPEAPLWVRLVELAGPVGTAA